jgi:hypothetical protein
LLDPSPANLKLLGNQAGVHAMINNSLTDPGDILLVKLHFTWWIVGEIMPTKSLAYTTPLKGKPVSEEFQSEILPFIGCPRDRG